MDLKVTVNHSQRRLSQFQSYEINAGQSVTIRHSANIETTSQTVWSFQHLDAISWRSSFHSIFPPLFLSIFPRCLVRPRRIFSSRNLPFLSLPRPSALGGNQSFRGFKLIMEGLGRILLMFAGSVVSDRYRKRRGTSDATHQPGFH